MCWMHFDIDDRVSLRAFRPEDRQDLVNGLNDWAVARWLGRVPHPYRLDHADAFLARDEHLHIDEAVQDGSRSLSLSLCDDDQVIGGFVLNPQNDAGSRELGFWLARPYWGQGIMRRAAHHVINEIRHATPEVRLVASVNADNIRSNQLIRRLGFHPSGRSEVWSTPLQRVVQTNCYAYKR